MRDFLITMLKAMERIVPPPVNCHHAITFAQYGSDDAGWTDQLALQINRAGTFHCFFLDEADLAKQPEVLAEEVSVLLAKDDPAAQLGVGPGQYLGDAL